MNTIANPGTEAQSRKFYFTPEAAKRIESKEDTTTNSCNFHPALNVKTRALKVTSGADKKTPNFMIARPSCSWDGEATALCRV
jgi:hypothetical protein